MPQTSPELRRSLLVTGFGAFPGAPRNPTAAIIEELRRREGRFARLGVALRCEVMPVQFAGLGDRLDALVRRHRPDAILHLGVAGRRRRICIETRAVNRAGPLHPDASGRCPEPILIPRGKAALRATYPASRILAELRRHGFDAEASIDTGDYVCNATLYRSLDRADVPEVGFIHVPRPQSPTLPKARAKGRRPTDRDLARAVLLAALAMVSPPARRHRPGPAA